MKVNVSDKVKEIKELYQTYFKEISSDDLRKLFIYIGKYHYKRRTTISKQHKEVYRFFERRGYNMGNINYWLMYTSLPTYLKNEVKVGSIPFNKALEEHRKNRSITKKETGDEILLDIRKMVSYINEYLEEVKQNE